MLAVPILRAPVQRRGQPRVRVAPPLRKGRSSERVERTQIEQPIEAATDHRCALAELTRRLADSRANDRADAAVAAPTHPPVEGPFDSCCVPPYLPLAAQEAARGVQVP